MNLGKKVEGRPLAFPEAPGGKEQDLSVPQVLGKGPEAQSGPGAAGSSRAMPYSENWLKAWVPGRAYSPRDRGAGVKQISTPGKPRTGNYQIKPEQIRRKSESLPARALSHRRGCSPEGGAGGM